MVTPAKGDFASIPLTPEARRVGERWDPAKDEASGDVCKAYGAAGIMRLPGRVHITWQDDSTLKIETDTGMQTRLLIFSGKPPDESQAVASGIFCRAVGATRARHRHCRVRDSAPRAKATKARRSKL